MFRIKCIFFVAILICSKLFAAGVYPPDTLKMKPFFYEPELRKYYRYYKDCSNNGVAGAILALDKGLFEKNTADIALNKSITSCTYWLALNVKNDTTTDFPILWNFFEDGTQFTVYDITNAAHPIIIGSCNAATSMSKRYYPVRSVTFPIPLQHGQVKRLLAKCNIITDMHLYVNTDIATPEDSLQYEVGYSFKVGHYFGFFIFALIFNFLLFLFTKGKLFLWQSLYITSVLTLNILELLFDALLFPDWLHFLVTSIPKYAFFASSLFCSIKVFELFTNHPTRFPLVSKYLQYIKIVSLCFFVMLILPCLVHFSNNELVFYCRKITGEAILVCYGIFVLMVIYGAAKKDRLHQFYLLSTLPILIGAISFISNGLFGVKLFHIEPGNLVVGLTIELMLQTLFFSYRYKFIQQMANAVKVDEITTDRKISQSVLLAQEQERTRISEDLHDQISNDFISLKLLTQSLIKSNMQQGLPIDPETLEKMEQLIVDMNASVRTITHALAEKNIEDVGLFEMLYMRVKLLNNSCETLFAIEAEGDAQKLTVISQITIYRIVLEAVTNIIKHAKATKATLKLLIHTDFILFEATDNGKGFVPGKIKHGLGMHNMEIRAKTMKGTFSLQTNIDGGCTVKVEIPVVYHLK